MTEPNKNLPSKWSDEFMFVAEPSDRDAGPKVFLLQGTPDPLGSIAAMAKMYMGQVVRNKADVTDDERRHFLREMQNTKLKAPMEAVTLHFMVEGVTRGFTHQMVRQRTAVYAQESTRFAVKRDVKGATAWPPSIAPGTQGSEIWEETWDRTLDAIDQAYNSLVDAGMPAEDARGLLPTNLLTRLNYVTNLRNLQDHAGNRLCTQAQFEWRMVWVRIIESMRDYCTCPGADRHAESCDNWQWQAIAALFRPVCYLTGSCQFKAEFDRKCSIRGRVDEFSAAGVPSSGWLEGDPLRRLLPIHPSEWLLDAGAAR